MWQKYYNGEALSVKVSDKGQRDVDAEFNNVAKGFVYNMARADFWLILRVWEILPTSKNALCVYKCTACPFCTEFGTKIVIPNSDNRPVLLGICVLKFGITFFRYNQVVNIEMKLNLNLEKTRQKRECRL